MVMELVSSIVEGINNCLWGIPMIGLLFGTHLFLTFRTGFIQRRTFTGIRLSGTRAPDYPDWGPGSPSTTNK